jgi:hypothetical protein
MSTAVREVVHAFQALSVDDQRVAAAVILQLLPLLEYPPLDDETLDRLADESFLEYDRDEAADAQNAKG